MAIEIDWTASPLTPEEQEAEDIQNDFVFLAREFLTWLVYHADTEGGVFEGFAISVGNKVTLRAAVGMVTDVTLKGVSPSTSADLCYALAGGLGVKEVELSLFATEGERVFSFALAAENFDLKRVKLPALLTEEEDDRIAERQALLLDLDGFVKKAFTVFLRLREAGTWTKDVVPQMRVWLEEGTRSA